MIPVEEKLPYVGEKTRCRVNYWRHKKLHHTEEIEAVYKGWNDLICKPMWDIETYGESFAEVTHWEPIITLPRDLLST